MSQLAFRYLSPALVRGVPLPEHAPKDLDPNHHLWKNGRTWWIAFTVRSPGGPRRRLRFSLGTRDVSHARERRDTILIDYERKSDLRLSVRYARLGA